MQDTPRFHPTPPGIVADVGRNTIRVGLTNEQGRLDYSSVREYDPSAQPTIAAAISTFGQETGLKSLPQRACIAVSGVPRGEIISITGSRWILSRAGLTAMFRAPPLVINDLAANAWAMSDPDCSGRIEPMTPTVLRADLPGTYCMIGLGSGLGVAIMSRDEHGLVNVLPTEAGHLGLMHGVEGADRILNRLSVGGAPVTAEMLFSGGGLLSTYNAICDLEGRPPACTSLSQLLNPATNRSDRASEATFDFVGRAFWHFAGNIALAYGAWDGLILTGSIAAALKSTLRRPDFVCAFNLKGYWTRHLANIPKATISFRYAELEGAAVALLMDEQRKRDAPISTLTANVA
jgi:glucokinase